METKIDPTKITNYSRSQDELDLFALFCVCAAGKNSDVQAEKIHHMLQGCKTKPLHFLLDRGPIRMLESVKMGQYDRISKAIRGLSVLDLSTCTAEDLARVHGIRFKTAHFFLMHTRPDHFVPVLDTHILNWLREVSGNDTVPKQSPQSQEGYHYWAGYAYGWMTKIFPGREMADVDMAIWKAMRMLPANEELTLKRCVWSAVPNAKLRRIVARSIYTGRPIEGYVMPDMTHRERLEFIKSWLPKSHPVLAEVTIPAVLKIVEQELKGELCA